MSGNRNGVFRVSPRGGERKGRFILNPSGNAVPEFAPVVVTAPGGADGRAVVSLATGAQNKPLPGRGGILAYEQFRMDGYDPVSSTYSDVGTVEPGKSVQVIDGENRVKIALRNTTAGAYRANYPTPRVMVTGMGATPTLQAGDMLTPGTGDDSSGYWTTTSNAAEAWLIVNNVDVASGWVEATLNF